MSVNSDGELVLAHHDYLWGLVCTYCAEDVHEEERFMSPIYDDENCVTDLDPLVECQRCSRVWVHFRDREPKQYFWWRIPVMIAFKEAVNDT